MRPSRLSGMLLAGSVVPALLVAGCHSGRQPVAASPTPSSPAPSPSGAARPTPAAPVGAAGLNGSPAGLGRPVLAVKIDNTGPSHPQVGLGSADIVYVEEVEGELTRLLAVFSSHPPAVVGPTRSARESDLELLRQYGRVALAYSGANRGVLRAVRRAPVVDAGFDVLSRAYFRDFGRPMPYNLFVRPATVLAAKKPVKARDIGLRFGAPVPTGGRASLGFSVRFGPYASAAVRYDPRTHRWRLSMDGRKSLLAGGGQIAPANVVVQYVKVRGSRFHDVNGNVSPFTVSVGSGKVTVFRDGRAYSGRWSRPKATGGTRFRSAAGRDLLLRPGQTWILLVRNGLPLRKP